MGMNVYQRKFTMSHEDILFSDNLTEEELNQLLKELEEEEIHEKEANKTDSNAIDKDKTNQLEQVTSIVSDDSLDNVVNSTDDWTAQLLLDDENEQKTVKVVEKIATEKVEELDLSMDKNEEIESTNNLPSENEVIDFDLADLSMDVDEFLDSNTLNSDFLDTMDGLEKNKIINITDDEKTEEHEMTEVLIDSDSDHANLDHANEVANATTESEKTITDTQVEPELVKPKLVKPKLVQAKELLESKERADASSTQENTNENTESIVQKSGRVVVSITRSKPKKELPVKQEKLAKPEESGDREDSEEQKQQTVKTKISPNLDTLSVANQEQESSTESNIGTKTKIKTETKDDATADKSMNKPIIDKPTSEVSRELQFLQSSQELLDLSENINQQIRTLKSALKHITDVFGEFSDMSADMIANTRQLQHNSKDDFSISYEQMHELRSQIISTRKHIGDLPSMLDLVEEAMESDLYVAETRRF